MRMLRRLLQATVLVSLVAIAGCYGTREMAQRDNMMGQWDGEVTEGDLNYDLLMSLERLSIGEPAGTVEYSGALNCSGGLTLESQNGATFVFRESIDHVEVCADGGRIEAMIGPNGQMNWRWFVEGEDGPAAFATLARR